MGEDDRPPLGALGIALAIVILLMCGSTLASHDWGRPRGVGTVSRPLLAALGVVGAVLLLRRRAGWFPLVLGWAAIQIPVVIVDGSGPLTNQSFHAGMQWVNRMTVNGAVVKASGYGFNLVGGVLALWALRVRAGRLPDPALESRRARRGVE